MNSSIRSGDEINNALAAFFKVLTDILKEVQPLITKAVKEALNANKNQR